MMRGNAIEVFVHVKTEMATNSVSNMMFEMLNLSLEIYVHMGIRATEENCRISITERIT